MKKVIILLVLLLVTGCTATYNLEIKNDVFKENISINMTGSNKNQIDYFKNNTFYSIMDRRSNFKEYNKKIIEKSDYSKANFSYNYKLNDYRKSTTLSTCFDAYNIIDEDGYYIISTSKGIKCAKEEDTVMLDKVKIVIKTNHKLKETNTNNINKYIYTWEFDEKDYDKANIYLKIYKDKYVFNYENEILINILIISSFVLIIGIFTFIIFRKVNKAKKV